MTFISDLCTLDIYYIRPYDGSNNINNMNKAKKPNKDIKLRAVREYKKRLVEAIRDSDVFEITCSHCYITDKYYDEQDDLINLIKKIK